MFVSKILFKDIEKIYGALEFGTDENIGNSKELIFPLERKWDIEERYFQTTKIITENFIKKNSVFAPNGIKIKQYASL